jgi:protease-4
MKKTILITILFLSIGVVSGFSFEKKSGDAALIQLSGTIQSTAGSGFGASGVTPGQVRELNDDALDQGADAIVYEINSPGGAVVASKEIYRDIDDVEVPTVCRLRDAAASGGYLVALGCDRIVADSASLTGSIGVRSSYLQYPGLMDKLGVEYVSISNGSLKEVGNPYENVSEEDKEVLQSMVDRLKDDFIQQVDQNRNLTNESREEVASSKPFLGEKAKKIGLVDELGGRDTAVNEAENLTGNELETFKVESKPSFNFLSLLSAQLSLENFLSSSPGFKAEIGR